tara:strand:- start:5632 stop:6021 length:390 start_codon:yes stop_codon:yes gene_type:complete
MKHLIGIGTDIIKTSRIKNSIKNKKFIKRIYSPEEIKIAKNINRNYNYFAKRYCAKEAFVKALGTGFSCNISFKDISILNNNKGKPFIKLNQKIKDIIKKKLRIKNFSTYVSISDEREYSIAFVIINRK